MFFKISDYSCLTLTLNRSQQLVIRYSGKYVSCEFPPPSFFLFCSDSDLGFFCKFLISLNLLIKQVFLQRYLLANSIFLSSVIEFSRLLDSILANILSNVTDYATCSRCRDNTEAAANAGKKSGKLPLRDLFWAVCD
jgi:hypothetical protein